MDIPLDEVVHFDAIAEASTGAAADADSTPTFAVYEESTDTDIGVGGNMTKRTSLTGNYRGSFTASSANGFELGKWYNVIGSATIGSVACKGVLMRFRIIAAEATAGYNVSTLKVGTGTGEVNLASGVVPANVTHFGGSAGTFASGRPEVNSSHIGGSAISQSSGVANVNVTQVSGDSAAADNLEAAADGTGYNLGGGQVVAASVTGNVGGNVAGSVGSVTGNVGGNVTGSVGSVVGNVGGNVTGSVGSLAAQAKADVNAEVDSALDTAIPGTPTNNSINERVKTLDDAYTGTRAAYLDNINNSGLQTTIAQTGDAYAIVNSGTHGNAALKTLIDAVQADLPQRITKNTALSAFPFTMVSSTDHVTGATGLTVTATRSLDGGAFGACANAVSEVSNGVYKIDLAAGDLNGNTVVLKFTATGADARLIHLVTQPT